MIEADLTTAEGCRTIRTLTADADVFLHNWAPGKASRLGLAASDLLPGSLRSGLRLGIRLRRRLR